MGSIACRLFRGRSSRLALALVLPALLLACGGSGDPAGGEGDPGPPSPLLAGAYHTLWFERDLASGTLRSTTARYGADGRAALTGEAAWTAGGTGGAGPLTPPGLAFAVTADHALTLTPAGEDALQGRVAADGSVAIAAAAAPGANPRIVILARRHLAPTQDDLYGEWWEVGLGTGGAATLESTWREVWLDEQGREHSGLWLANADGSILRADDTTRLPDDSEFRAQPDGWITLSHEDIGGARVEEGRGALSEDGLLLLLGAVRSGAVDRPAVRLLARRGASVRQADLGGSFGLIGLGKVTSSFYATQGEAAFDDLGQGELTQAFNFEGAVPPAPTVFPASSFVYPGGRFLLSVNASVVLEGLVSPDPRFAVFGGGFGPGDEPQILMLLR